MFARDIEVSPVFVDTNILLYSVDVRASPKRVVASTWLAGLWSTGAGRLSWQVLNEFYENATRKFALPTAVARHTATRYALWNPVSFSLPVLERAWHWIDHAQISYWDALIVAAAEHSGARWLLTEDLQAGMRFDSVTVVNPFTTIPEELGFTVPPE